MEKKYFFLRLNSSRPDFNQTMTPGERTIMQKHVGYWIKNMEMGWVLTFGPVLDPAGAFGIGIVGVDKEEQVTELMKNDPAASILQYECYPMLAVVPKK